MTLLIIIQFFIFVITSIKLFRKDVVATIFYGIVYLYCLPTTIVYGFFPEWLRESFHTNYWSEFFWFTSLSLFSFWYVIYRHSTRTKCIQAVEIAENKTKKNLVIILTTIFTLIFLLLLYQNQGSISYVNMYDKDFRKGNTGINLLSLMQPYLNMLIYIFLIKLKSINSWKKNKLLIVLVILMIFGVVYFSNLAGSRSNILALGLGVAFIYLYGRKVSIKLILPLAIVGFLAINLMSSIRSNRSEGFEAEEATLLYTALNQDYTSPSMNIIAAIEKQIIIPSDVVLSNIVHMVIKLDYPYLHEIVGDKVFTGGVSSDTGYGYYIFTEGYMFMGPFGFLYNAIVLGFLFLLWRKLAHTNDSNYNLFISAMFLSLAFALVRTQSSYFVKNLYLFFIPMSIAYAWLMDKKIRFKRFLK